MECWLGMMDLAYVLTHAVKPPCIFQLVFPPFCGYAGGFFVAEMGGELFGDGFGGEEGAVDVEGEDDGGGHVEAGVCGYDLWYL